MVYLPLNVETAPVPLHRRELGQVVVNLILNAIQASPEGGTVTIDVEQQRDLLRVWSKKGAGLTDDDR
ncbi:MAG: ATP-binding protein [Plectolyngbya sp. WJT66-NPBG17]|nr:ATP-binding protein [Plectolyngbya sp. WJT66-NPBG17]MBW4528372.1 ATP-binding protein [Phormidium tanganyikae FI6-MK23]